MEKDKKHAGGRPTKYKQEYCDLAYNYCLLGATDTDLSRNFSVAESRINQWKKDHPEFKEAIKRGKDVADANIAKSLYHRAKGYSHPDEEIKIIKDEVVRVPTTKHYPPDTTACIFWLKNRCKENWRDKTEHDHTVKTTLEDLICGEEK